MCVCVCWGAFSCSQLLTHIATLGGLLVSVVLSERGPLPDPVCVCPTSQPPHQASLTNHSQSSPNYIIVHICGVMDIARRG